MPKCKCYDSRDKIKMAVHFVRQQCLCQFGQCSHVYMHVCIVFTNFLWLLRFYVLNKIIMINEL